MSIYKYGLAAVLALSLVACGGGGGEAGKPNFGGSTGGTGGTGGTDGTGGVTQPAYQMTLQLQNIAGVDIASNAFAASDSVTLQATLKTAAGAPVAYEVVSFAEAGGGLLQFMPTAATALTDASGQARVVAKAKDLVSLGATTVTATATVAGTAYAASRTLSVREASGDPQTLAKAVNPLTVVPADKSIVPADAGGNGRSKTAILSFQVVDGVGAPVPGVRVTFETIPADVVVLNNKAGITDISGLVSASVSAPVSPTSFPAVVVVNVKVVGTLLETRSDLLTVTNGVAVKERFTLSASKFVLNSDIHLDSSTITVAVGDAPGAPVADGFAVVATATHGLIGTSSRGGCTTVNGECTLPYRLQSQNLNLGEPILITVSGASTAGTLSETIALYATSVNSINLYPAGGGAAVTPDFPTLTFNPVSCRVAWAGRLGTANGTAAPAGATLTVQSSNDTVSVSLSSGSPVLDSRDGSATNVGLEFALNEATQDGETDLTFTLSAGSLSRTFNSTLSYTACPTPTPPPP